MTAKRRYSFFITEWQAAALKQLKQQSGSAEGELIRQALNEYLERKGFQKPKSDRLHAPTRKRS